MSVATIETFIEDGQIKLPPNLRLPERTKVYVIVPDATVPSSHFGSPRLAHPEQAGDFRKQVGEEKCDARV